MKLKKNTPSQQMLFDWDKLLLIEKFQKVYLSSAFLDFADES